jgi:hypothetical protein
MHRAGGIIPIRRYNARIQQSFGSYRHELRKNRKYFSEFPKLLIQIHNLNTSYWGREFLQHPGMISIDNLTGSAYNNVRDLTEGDQKMIYEI